VVAVEISRLLRRGLLVTAIAAAGWLLSAAFAGTASAEGLPGDNPQTQEQPSGGLLGGLIGGVTNTITGLTDTVVGLTGTVVDTTTSLLTPVTHPAQEPIIDVPALLPVDDWTGSNETARPETQPAPAAPAPVAPAPQPVVPAPVHVTPAAPKPAAAPAPAAAQTAPQERENKTGYQTGTGSAPEPVKTPAGPSSPGSSVSAAHDNSGGARGTHGVLVSHTTLVHPADAGFTTRSRAVNAAGRDAGLPVSTPD